jgi:phage terminase large subunit GpA-like protein
MAKNRLDPLFDRCPALDKHKLSDTNFFNLMEKTLDRMTIYLVGSNSPANLASLPCRYCIIDEADKCNEATDEESSAIDLAIERTKGAGSTKKIVIASTPTTLTGAITRFYEQGDQRRFFVPCPKCGFEQILETSQVKCDEAKCKVNGVRDLAKVEETAWYECCHCKAKITDAEKPEMLLKGKWKASKHNAKHHSYHLPSVYPSWIRFGQYLAKFFQAQADAKKGLMSSIQNFRNSWEAVPWAHEVDAASHSTILEHACEYEASTCPEQPIAVVVTADYGTKTPPSYVVRAWCRDHTSYLLKYGTVPSLAELAKAKDWEFKTPQGVVRPNSFFIDSGFDSKVIYDFCKANGWYPLKGSDSARQDAPFKWSTLPDGQKLFNIQTDKYKDFLQHKLAVPKGERGSWNLHIGTTEEYADHLTAEVRQTVALPNGGSKIVWKKIRAANHFLDCEVYQLAVADAFNFKETTSTMQPIEIQKSQPAPRPQAQRKEEESRFARPDGRGFWDLAT